MGFYMHVYPHQTSNLWYYLGVCVCVFKWDIPYTCILVEGCWWISGFTGVARFWTKPCGEMHGDFIAISSGYDHISLACDFRHVLNVRFGMRSELWFETNRIFLLKGDCKHPFARDRWYFSIKLETWMGMFWWRMLPCSELKQKTCNLNQHNPAHAVRGFSGFKHQHSEYSHLHIHNEVLGGLAICFHVHPKKWNDGSIEAVESTSQIEYDETKTQLRSKIHGKNPLKWASHLGMMKDTVFHQWLCAQNLNVLNV